MTLDKNLRVILYLFLIIYSVTCAPSGTEEGNDKQKEETDSSKEDSDEKETISPEKMDELKEEIIENQNENAEKFDLQLTSAPDQIEKFLKVEEEEYGKDLPEKIEESITDAGDLKNLIHFIELFDKIEIESGGKEEETEPKSPEEVKEMKDEIFRLINEVNEKKDLPEASREDFDRVWNQKKEMYGEKFPNKVERMLAVLNKKVEEKEEPTTVEKVTEAETEAPSVVTEPDEEKTPINAFALKNAKGKICILAKFHTSISMTKQNAEVHDPSNVNVTGKCGDASKSRQLHLSWENLIFTLVFNKTSEDTWVVKSIEFNYDTSDKLFDGAVNGGKVLAKSKKENFFETPLGKSYFCSAQEVIPLYSDNQQVAIVQLKEVHIQPYDVKDGKFSTSHHCTHVVIGGLDDEPFVQDETIPLAVGCTLALITLLILVGFSVHRAYNAAKVDYNTME